MRKLWALWIVVAVALPAVAEAEIIDRMLAVVDGEVVTESDLEDYRALARGFGQELPADDAAVLDQVIEDMLLSRLIAQFPGNAIREEDLETYLAGFRDSGELSAERLRTLAMRRLDLERYYASLRRSLRATDEEVRRLYEDEFVPQLLAGDDNAVVPPLSAVGDQLSEIVIADKLVEEISLRVETLYRRYQVEVVE